MSALAPTHQFVAQENLQEQFPRDPYSPPLALSNDQSVFEDGPFHHGNQAKTK